VRDIETGLTHGSEEFVGIGERCIFVCAVFWNGGGKERTTYLRLCPPLLANHFPDPESIPFPIPRTLTLEHGQLSHWPVLEMTIEAHNEWVFCVAFSPDGRRIASASDDRTIRVWDATTGQIVAGPLTGHTDSVRSVAFSPDGEGIASASEDRTIRVWDITTGQVVADPFTGHTDSVTPVAFPPDEQNTYSMVTLDLWKRQRTGSLDSRAS
jgi:WD40 repeat protein